MKTKTTNITPEERRDLIEAIHANAVAKGFWAEDHSEDHYRMLVITELSEAVEAHRRGDFARREGYQMALEIRGVDFDQALFLGNIKDSVEDELADAVIRIYDMMGTYENLLDEYHINEDTLLHSREEELHDLESWGSFEFSEQVLRCVAYLLDYQKLYWDRYVETIAAIEAVAEYNGIDIYWHVREKMKYNATRPPLHGKKY